MTELQTKEYKENSEADQCSTEEMIRRVGKPCDHLAAGTTLFFLQFNLQAIGTVKGHLYTRKECHQYEGDDKKYDDVNWNHGLKIVRESEVRGRKTEDYCRKL
jgi:hypothetical protein